MSVVVFICDCTCLCPAEPVSAPPLIHPFSATVGGRVQSGHISLGHTESLWAEGSAPL